MTHTSEANVIRSWTEREVGGPVTSFALEARAEVLWFVAGARAWPLNDPTLSFRLETVHESATSVFTVSRGEKKELVFRYRHLGRELFSRIDPTYDALDAANDHPLLLVAQQGNSPQWQQAQLEQGRRGHGAA